MIDTAPVARRITFVLPPLNPSGGIIAIAELAARLRRRGHEARVVCPSPEQPNLRDQLHSLLRGRGRLPAIPVEAARFDELSVPLRIVDHAGPLTDADLPDADVVVATWWETAEWVARLVPSKGIGVYLIQGHEVYPYLPRERVIATYRLPLHKIVVSNWLQELMRERYGDRRVSLMPVGVDSERYDAPPRSRQAVPTVGLVYSALPVKGTDIALEAYERAAREIPGLRLVTFGFTPPAPELPLPQGTDYACRPTPDAIRARYAACDAWLFGSRAEGFGLPILEAMACRTPVVATPAGAAPELLSGGGGLLADAADPATLARALVRLYRAPEARWRRWSEAARATARAYSWEVAACRFEAAALDAIAARCRRGGAS